MMAEGLTREGLVFSLMEKISMAEKKKLFEADREYTLNLLRDVLLVLDTKSLSATTVGSPKSR